MGYITGWIRESDINRVGFRVGDRVGEIGRDRVGKSVSRSSSYQSLHLRKTLRSPVPAQSSESTVVYVSPVPLGTKVKEIHTRPQLNTLKDMGQGGGKG